MFLREDGCHFGCHFGCRFREHGFKEKFHEYGEFLEIMEKM